METGYHCSKCNRAVIVLKGQAPVRACKCEGASIIAEMSGTVIRGGSKLKHNAKSKRNI